MKFEIAYDLRNPPHFGRPSDLHYGEFLDQVQWADQNGFTSLTLAEHHFSDDGYMPNPVVVAAAAAARTKRLRLGISLVLLPLHHPVRLAEDTAMVDIFSGGRLDLTVGAGYRPVEYEGFGLSMKQRGGRMEEGVEILKRCWTEEEPFDYDGRYWKLTSVCVKPKPVQQPRPKVRMGGASPASARRAARVADEYEPIHPGLWRFWAEEMRALGKDPGIVPGKDTPRQPANLLWVARDPEAAWAKVGPHALAANNSYADFAGNLSFGPYQWADTPDELLARGGHAVLTPEQAIELGKAMEAHDPGRAKLKLNPMIGGLPAAIGQECLEQVRDAVMPAFA
ncbi:MAG: LLM class flavin-dependent oxidoreductase [Dehalococcoidia bacterium]|nr:LLM class flavin-dependent oxidoreductase [Dehalococcoidia bacterium]